MVLAEESSVVLSYSTRDEPPFQPTTAPLAIVRFGEPYLHLFGPPLHLFGQLNEDAAGMLTSETFTLVGHPLAGRGLFQYGVFRVDHSSLVRHLEQVNSAHPYQYHDQPKFDGLTHYVFTFYDSTFECVAASLEATVENSGLDEEHGRMRKHLNRE
jgi:hypothetical protein